MKKIFLMILPLIFTAQACNLLGSREGSGSQGVFVSTDRGDTWEERNRVSQNDNLQDAQISRIFIEQGSTSNILAATLNNGLYATDSRGEAWVSLLPGFAAYDSFINPFNNQEIFAAGAKSRQAVIYRSADRGGTWVQIYNQPSGEAAVTALAFDPTDPDILYAGFSTGAVLKSADQGKTWTLAGDLQDRIAKIVIAADSNRTAYVLSRTKGMFRSQDRGQTWTNLPLAFLDETEGETPGFNSFVLDPNNFETVFLATTGGLQKSGDGGQTWSRINLPTTPGKDNISAVAVNPRDSGQIFASIRFDVYRSDDRGLTWSTHALPTRRTIFQLAIDETEPSRIYAGTR